MSISDQRNVQILYINTDSRVTRLVTSMLERQNDQFDIKTAPSASDGLAIVESHSVDCIVSDYNVSDMTGVEFLEIIDKQYLHTPYLLFIETDRDIIATDATPLDATDSNETQDAFRRYNLLANRVLSLVQQQNIKNIICCKNLIQLTEAVGQNDGFRFNDNNGTGFGLRIVKQIVNAHGWDITITDSEDGGARFEITGVEITDETQE